MHEILQIKFTEIYFNLLDLLDLLENVFVFVNILKVINKNIIFFKSNVILSLKVIIHLNLMLIYVKCCKYNESA